MAAEADIQRDICRYLKKQKHLFWRFSPETYNAKLGIHIKHEYMPSGLPDLMLVHPGDTKEFPHHTFIGLEVKGPRGKPSADQILMQKRFGLANAEYYIVRSVDEVKELGL